MWNGTGQVPPSVVSMDVVRDVFLRNIEEHRPIGAALNASGRAALAGQTAAWPIFHLLWR
jgi:hypothetical protein